MSAKWVTTESGYEIKKNRAALVVQKRDGRYEWCLYIDETRRCESSYLYRNAKDAKNSAIRFVRSFTADMSTYRAIKELVEEPWRPVVAGEVKPAKKPEPKKQVETSFTIKGSKLARLLGKVVNQADVAETPRPALSCVHLESTGRVIKSVATNGHSMATYFVECDGKKAVPFTNLLIDAKDAIEIAKEAKNNGDKLISVMVKKGKIRVGGMVYECCGYEYPDYKQVTDVEGKNASLVISVKVNDLREMLDSAKKIVVKKYPTGSWVSAEAIKKKTCVYFRVVKNKKTIVIKVVVYFQQQNIEDTIGDVAAEIVSGYVKNDETIIGFNVALLKKALENVSDGTVCLGIENDHSPMSMWDESDKAYYGIVMPVRIR